MLPHLFLNEKFEIKSIKDAPLRNRSDVINTGHHGNKYIYFCAVAKSKVAFSLRVFRNVHAEKSQLSEI